MNIHHYKDLKIEVLDEPTFKFGATDNKFNYSKSYFGNGANEYPTSNHGVKIFQDDVQINNVFSLPPEVQLAFIKIHHLSTIMTY
jgi:hypothetical protein